MGRVATAATEAVRKEFVCVTLAELAAGREEGH
jgi:hypothetical protein